MIKQSVSHASDAVVKVPGYEQLVRFGYTKNRGAYRLAVTASGEWRADHPGFLARPGRQRPAFLAGDGRLCGRALRCDRTDW